MKKVFQTAFLTLVAISLFVVTVNASSSNANFNNIVESPLAVINYQGSEDNIIKDSFIDIFEKLKDEGDLNLSLSDLKTINLFNDIFLSNNISLVIVNPDYDGLTYMLLEASDSEFDRVLKAFSENNSLIESEYDEHTIYSLGGDGSFVIYNGSIIVTDSVENTVNVLTSLKSDNLDMNQYERKFQDDHFLSGIVFSELIDEYHKLSYGTEIPSGDTIFSISEPSSNTFQIETYASISESEYRSIGIDITSSTFTPELYKVVPGENLAFYMEFNNLASAISSTLDTVLGSDPSFAYELDLIISDPLFDILDGNTAISVALPSNNIIPEITLITENTSSNLANSANERVFQLIEEALYTDVNQSVSEFNTFSYDLNQDAYEIYFDEASDFELHFGQIDDYYVITTNSDIESKLGTNTLEENSKFMKAFRNVLDKNDLTSIAYIEPANSIDYIEYAYQHLSEDLYEDEKQIYRDTLSIIKDLDESYSYTRYSHGQEYSFAQISIPLKDIIDMSIDAAIASASYYADYQYERLTDVEDSDWYAEDLRVAVRRGIIKGKKHINEYGSPTHYFDASDATTRAEFVAMLIRHYNLEWQTAPAGSTIFNDVSATAWYNQNIGIAHSVGIISETEGNFRPKENITRAEAVKMMHNFSTILKNVEPTSNPFRDVSNSDSFADAVNAAYVKGIVTGTTPTTFEPYKNLNRAEAVVIINRVANKELAAFQ